MKPVGRPNRSLNALALVGAALVLPSLGCGGGSDKEAKVTGTLAVSVTELAPGRARYHAPRTIPAGLTKITIVNEGRERHKAQLVRIQGNHSIAQARRARRPFPKWVYLEGGVGMTGPGKRSSVVQRLDPGNYYVTGTYGERGQVAPLRVVGKKTSGGLPPTTASIVTNEYSFIPSDVKAGTTSVEFRNEGLEPHHAVFAPVRRGSTSVRRLRQFLKGTGPIPVGKLADIRNAQETAVIERGQKQVVTLHLKPGKYALLCFVPDRKGGPPHVVKGMVDELTVR